VTNHVPDTGPESNRLPGLSVGEEEDEGGQDEESEIDEEDYWEVNRSHNPSVRNNVLVHSITALRILRRRINTGIRLLARLFLTPDWRDRVDAHPGDARHYFYRHCHIFRYLDKHRQILYQGYYANCIHLDRTAPTPRPRQARPPINPLITADEDEFLAQAANVMELGRKGELANIIRRFRRTSLPHAKAAHLLFDHLYLDTVNQTDMNGIRRAIIWNDGDL
jgi:hypothetical protein